MPYKSRLISDQRAFEEWLIENHPYIFEEWELEVSHLLELEEFVQRLYWKIWEFWNRN